MKKICLIVTMPSTIHAFLLPHIFRLSQIYNLTIISNFKSKFPKSIDNVRFIDVDIVRGISIWKDIKSLFTLLSIMQNQSFDVVHTVTPKAGLLGMMAGKFSRVPIRIHWYTGQVWVTKNGVFRVFLKFFDKLISYCATNLLADSPSQKDFLVAEKVCKLVSLKVIANGSICGVDTQRFRPNSIMRDQIRKEFNIPVDSIVILFLGRLNFDKGLREITSVIPSICYDFPNVHWLVVGPDEEGLLDYITSNTKKYSNFVHIHGSTTQPENFMMAADIFCLPSYREGFGNVVLEAASTGVPSVASRIYGLTDAVEDGVTGLLFSVSDTNELSNSLKKLISNNAYRKTMSKAARARVIEKFSQMDVVEGLVNYYKFMLES